MDNYIRYWNILTGISGPLDSAMDLTIHYIYLHNFLIRALYRKL